MSETKRHDFPDSTHLGVEHVSLVEAGVGVLGDRLQTRLDHDLQRTAAAKDAGREDAEAHALQLVLAGPLHRVLVGSLQQLELVRVIREVGAVPKGRPDRVDHLGAGQVARDRDLGVAREAAAAGLQDRQGTARRLQRLPAAPIDLSVDPTPTEAPLVGRVDDRVARELDDAVERDVHRRLRPTQSHLEGREEAHHARHGRLDLGKERRRRQRLRRRRRCPAGGTCM